MKNVNFLLLILQLLTSCTNVASDNKQVGDGGNAEPSIRFYYREVGANDGYYTYTYFLVLENYRNNVYSVKQLADVATKYTDTAKADLPISSVVFVGEPKGTTLPKGMTKTYHLHVNYKVASASFNNSFRGDSLNKKMIDEMSLYRDGRPTRRILGDSLKYIDIKLNNERE